MKAARWPAAAGGVAVVIAAVAGFGGAWALGCAAVAGFALGAVATDLAGVVRLRMRHQGSSERWSVALGHVIDNDHRRYGGQLTHVAMLMVMIGVAGSSLFGIQENLRMTPGQTVRVGGYELTLLDLGEVRGANYNAVEARLTLREPAGATRTVSPQMRFYDKSEQPNSEVALESNLQRDVYLVLAGWEAGGKAVAIQVMINPLISWIWIGGVLMTGAGLFCLLPRLAAWRVALPAAAVAQVRPELAGAET